MFLVLVYKMFKNADIVVSYCDNIVAIRTTKGSRRVWLGRTGIAVPLGSDTGGALGGL